MTTLKPENLAQFLGCTTNQYSKSITVILFMETGMPSDKYSTACPTTIDNPFKKEILSLGRKLDGLAVNTRCNP